MVRPGSSGRHLLSRPLHWVVRALLGFNYRLRIAMLESAMECGHVLEEERSCREYQRTAEEYARGYLAGWHECFVMCLEEIEEELKCVDAVREFGSLLAEIEDRQPRSN